MALTTSGAPEITPEQVGALVVQPVMLGSVAAQIGTVTNISSTSLRIPQVTADPSAAWVAEGSEITPDDVTLDELEVTPSKVAGLSIISVELADDSSPSAQQLIGEGLARDIARKVDSAFFDADGSVTNGPAGIESVAASLETATYAASGPANLDWAHEALSLSEQNGGNLTSFVTDPATALAIAQLKEATGSNKDLLDARTVAGVQLLVSSAVTAGTIYGVDSRFVQIVVRQGSRLEVDRSVKFTSDQVAVKATMRVGFGFTHPGALVKITESA